ncbi:hypothetical protein BO83DRAFT_162308 [Aspergillus eucalypticola CBS 122712]|uniref:Uncharacterized protein n=1 Tax=Aspergillus eucalypticola (strain CBS 122712 / IBT 29274) TaxID=1448314 RepID=A0A317UMN6_ASPEC|nr:uncharacterized protein BO83DRAFT_162308 [Aspergillus eucalypticola CBS 122712]PWY63194.1 hypothetical protein BO83DRAFT_162308 [Aspergillus eucalypticola CBS 122712]
MGTTTIAGAQIIILIIHRSTSLPFFFFSPFPTIPVLPLRYPPPLYYSNNTYCSPGISP